jgi:hypothetical protein
MKNWNKAIGAISVALVLSGCVSQSQVPLVESYPLTYQKVLNASHHWDVMAADVAAQLKATISASGRASDSLSILDAPDRTEFNRAFQNLLMTQLVKSGVNVNSGHGSRLAATFDAQVIRQSRNAGPIPRTEVIVTTSLVDGNRIIDRRTDIYYVPEEDTALFAPVRAFPRPVLVDLRVRGDSK